MAKLPIKHILSVGKKGYPRKIPDVIYCVEVSPGVCKYVTREIVHEPRYYPQAPEVEDDAPAEPYISFLQSLLQPWKDGGTEDAAKRAENVETAQANTFQRKLDVHEDDAAEEEEWTVENTLRAVGVEIPEEQDEVESPQQEKKKPRKRSARSFRKLFPNRRSHNGDLDWERLEKWYRAHDEVKDMTKEANEKS